MQVAAEHPGAVAAAAGIPLAPPGRAGSGRRLSTGASGSGSGRQMGLPQLLKRQHSGQEASSSDARGASAGWSAPAAGPDPQGASPHADGAGLEVWEEALEDEAPLMHEAAEEGAAVGHAAEGLAEVAPVDASMEALHGDSIMDMSRDEELAEDAHESKKRRPSTEAAANADVSGQDREGVPAADARQDALGMPTVPGGEASARSGAADAAIARVPQVTSLAQMDAATWAELPPDVQAQLLRGMRIPGAVPDQAVPVQAGLDKVLLPDYCYLVWGIILGSRAIGRHLEAVLMLCVRPHAEHAYLEAHAEKGGLCMSRQQNQLTY